MVLVLICIVTAIVFALLSYFDHQNKELEKWNEVFVSISVSAIGVTLFTLRKYGLYKELFDSLELLMFLILPTITLIPVLSDQKSNVILFVPVYLGAVIGWLLLVKSYLIKPMPENIEKRFTHRVTNVMFGILMYIGAAVIWLFIFFIIPYFINPPPQ